MGRGCEEEGRGTHARAVRMQRVPQICTRAAPPRRTDCVDAALDHAVIGYALVELHLRLGLRVGKAPLAVNLLGPDGHAVSLRLLDDALDAAVAWLLEASAAHRHSRRRLVAALRRE